ncbi:MAG: 4Fe-4S dicluster domain-containing protein [Chloroflexi bacterium]|nr:4Fe-4S dicluster domain-containing protein [Chloroflexota bacterium]
MKRRIGVPETCVQCGTCVTVCPVEKVGGHAIVTFLADPEATDYSVWLCTSCWRCQEACPEGVDIYGLMMEQRRREQPPAGYEAAFESVLACGVALQVSQEELDQVRAAWGLEPATLPPPDLIRKLIRDGE